MLATFAAMVALFSSVLVATAPVESADAANASFFNPGLIISDTQFYDGSAMTASQIQSFLNSKIGTCSNGNCLNVGSIDYPGRARQVSEATGNLVCEAIQGGTMSTAELIYRTQVACGISAKVILVTLQKEQGLVTSKAPETYALSHAMGMACPDTAPCDPSFAGLGRQIVTGTVQLKMYKAGAFARQPGNQYVQYNPDSSCGGSYVNVQNYATAALYNYTPYQPNSAALGNLYGYGNGCSSYGNRNFWAYYSDWFGNPVVATVTDAAVLSYWNNRGAANGALGAPVTSGGSFSTTNGDGFVQVFTGGYVYSNAAGVFTVRPGTPSENTWTAEGWIRGKLGWPIAEESCSGSVCSQAFQGGTIRGSTIIGVFDPAVLAYWNNRGGASGALGAPATSGSAFSTTNGDGFVQVFAGGYVYSSPAGVFTVKSGTPLENAWTAAGWIRGRLGWPVGEESCVGSVCTQQFQGGTVKGSTVVGVFDTSIQSYWTNAGGASGALGDPLTAGGAFSTGSNGDGFVQVFTGGYVYSGPTGVYTVKPGTPLEGAWTAAGWIRGRLGWPTGEESCAGSVCTQQFQGGTIQGSTIVGAVTDPAVLSYWNTQGGASGALGNPLTAGGAFSTGSNGDGFVQVFTGGYVYSSAAGVFTVKSSTPLESAWTSAGWIRGRYGWPTAEAVCTGSVCSQQFQGGTVQSY